MTSEASPSSSGVDPDNPRKEDLELLALLEAQNRALEQDAKTKASIRPPCAAKGHSRQNSTASGHASNRSMGGSPTEHLQDEQHVQWGQIVSDWDLYVKKKNYVLKEMVRQGIPPQYRAIIWQLMCQTYNCPDLREKYHAFLKQSSPFEKLIKRDIARTYPNHEYFKEKDGLGQEGLLNVMKAYSLYDREVGYCQGSAFIVGLLLTIMNEEETFCVLVKLMSEYRLRDLFKPNMTELGLCMYQLECLLQEMLPDLYIHFQSQSFHTSTYASSWFLTLFSTNLPMEGARRVMDVFISEGLDAIFRIAIAILQYFRAQLIQQDMEGMLKCLQKDLPLVFEANSNAIMNASYQVKLNVRKMKKLEKEYMALKTREQEDMVELRRLRTENNLLRQRVTILEQETSDLADRLIKEQIERQRENEDRYHTKKDLDTTRRTSQDAMEKLMTANNVIRMLQDQMCGTAGTPGFNTYQKDAEITKLQKELRSVKMREIDSQKAMREMKERVQELEESNRRMRDSKPEHSVARMQEELTAVRMREAEANLSMKELRKRVVVLETEWQRHLGSHSSPTSDGGQSGPPKNSPLNLAQLQDELMTLRLREAETLADGQESRQRLMESESHCSLLQNQLRRQEEENQSLKQMYTQLQESLTLMEERLREEINRREDLDAELRTTDTAAKICEAEKNHVIAGLQAKISELEVRNEELLTARLLNESKNNVLRIRSASMEEDSGISNSSTLLLSANCAPDDSQA
ncbi:hypothetical protein RvY_16668 [Ramazzottius varieornatus]|uniref:Rab-GAP TBC domain-containing protein n=1 Tax=Ramazzottius varieornatus TaxID=947166 RepID=A0A1D1W3M3_RAMVA|nr:hypothetical protein RvY_16668 [Ramazzottius varieornatus]